MTAIIYEIRAPPRSKSEKVDTYQGITSRGMDRYRGINFGMVIQCEHGYFTGGRGGGWTYDNDCKKIKQFAGNDLLMESFDRLEHRLLSLA